MNNYNFLEHLPKYIKTVDTKPYAENSLGINRKVPGVVKPKNSSEIKEILSLATEHRISLSPISTGKNWGYGSSLSANPDSIILDLSDMKSIKYDSLTGIFRVEPGVTQSDLYNYLGSSNLKYLTPITGAGPNVSILGNALERGYGITPIEDHFLSLTGMNVILPDGSDYQPIMAELAGNSVWKWDIGPYVQGLFSQSCYGIVTEISMRLYPVPEIIGIFKATSRDLKSLVNAATAIRKLELVKGINIMNGHRINAMTGEKDTTNWTLIGSFYCPNELLGGTKRLIKRIFSESNTPVKIADTQSFRYLGSVLKLVSMSEYKLAKGFFDALRGIPTSLALNLVGTEDRVNEGGLIWYSPIVPNNSDLLKVVTAFIVDACNKFNIKPLITYTFVGPNVVDATIPIIFSKQNQLKDAWDCYDYLVSGGIKLGIIPYRFPINKTEIVRNTSANAVNSIIKKALDPNNVIASRYVV